MDGYSINKIEFGERIKCAREELKMTQAQFAQLLKTSQTTISKYERGEQLPGIDVLATISKETKKSADWLLFGNETASNKSEITSKQWLNYFYNLIQSPYYISGFVYNEIFDRNEAGSKQSIILKNSVGCKDDTDKWSDLNIPVATVSFYGSDMANFFKMLAAIDTVRGMLPNEQLKILENNALDNGAELFELSPFF